MDVSTCCGEKLTWCGDGCTQHKGVYCSKCLKQTTAKSKESGVGMFERFNYKVVYQPVNINREENEVTLLKEFSNYKEAVLFAIDEGFKRKLYNPERLSDEDEKRSKPKHQAVFTMGDKFNEITIYKGRK